MTKKRPLADRIKSHLWIFISFIPYLNGIGFVYIGGKTSNKQWIIEGTVYELVWVLFTILTLIYYPQGTAAYMLIYILLTVVAIIKANSANKEYQKILDEGKHYKKCNDKTDMVFGSIMSLFPFFNGFTFIYFGWQNKNIPTIIVGILFEIPWIIGIITLNLIFIKIGFGMLLISLIVFILICYTNEDMHYVVGEPKRKVASKREKPKPKKAPKKEKPKTTYEKTPFRNYKIKINNLTKEFDKKEEILKKVIEKRFEKSITYTNFINVINNAHENFYKQRDLSLDMINNSKNENIKIENEIKEKIQNLKEILKKIDELIEELILNTEVGEDEELDSLIKNLEDLIKNVKYYN